MSIKTVTLSEIENGKEFKIGDISFIKFTDADGVTTAVTKETVFNSEFGENNNLKESTVLERLNSEFLPRIADVVGIENICDITTDLTSLDGLKTYGDMTSKISIPTFDFYRANVEIFDKYKIDKWWWLATPDSTPEHINSSWIVCVSPSGNVFSSYCYYYYGVRPFLRFVSSISVSYEE